MNVTKNKRGHRTVTFAPYGRVPLHDAKESITLTLSEQACREGKRNNPAGCAIALQTKFDVTNDAAARIPGYLGVQVRKSVTLVAVSRKTGIAVLRWVHGAELNDRINGFDNDREKKLKAGDTVVLLAPKLSRRIGKHINGPAHANQKPTKNPRVHTKCVRRGVYLDPVHGKAATTDKSISVHA